MVICKGEENMPHQETPHTPAMEDMSVEEKWDRLHDFFTMVRHQLPNPQEARNGVGMDE